MTAPEKCPKCRFTPCRKSFQCSEDGGYRFVDPPTDLSDLESRATRDAQRLDGLHGDPSRAGGWIGHRDYARALVLLIPRLRTAESKVAALETRQQELLQTIVRLTNETPFPDEIKGWEAQRAAMVAEVGSLRARIAELERATNPAGEPQWRETWEVSKP